MRAEKRTDEEAIVIQPASALQATLTVQGDQTRIKGQCVSEKIVLM